MQSERKFNCCVAKIGRDYLGVKWILIYFSVYVRNQKYGQHCYHQCCQR
jgi:hypothetical protein